MVVVFVDIWSTVTCNKAWQSRTPELQLEAPNVKFRARIGNLPIDTCNSPPSSLLHTAMSRRTVTLPLRLSSASKPQSSQWTCRRCLATQTEPNAASSGPPYVPNEAPLPANYDPTLTSAQRTDPNTGALLYRLRKTDYFLKKALPQKIPMQYLQHSTAEHLAHTEKEQRAKTEEHREIVGVVVRSGKMDRTVTVRLPGQRWERKVGKVC